MKSRPELLGQKVLEPQLVRCIQGALSTQAGRHQLGNIAITGNSHADHGLLRHGGIVFVALEGGGILSDLETDKDK